VVLTGPELIDKLRVAVYVHLGNYIWAEFATESVWTVMVEAMNPELPPVDT
jgi:hypothetical protein